MDFYGEDGDYEECRISEENAKKLYQAVIRDAEEGNFEQLIQNGLRYRDMEDSLDETFYNTLTIQYVLKNESNGNRKTRNREYNLWSPQGAAVITFDKSCKNVIAALIDTGVIKGEDELYTREEMNQRGEKTETMLVD